MKQLFLGVDGGASKTSAVLIDTTGKVLAASGSEGSNASVLGLKRSVVNIKSAVKEVILDISDNLEIFGCFAIAGVDTISQRKIWEKLIRSDVFFLKLFSEMPLVVNDTLAALRSGTKEENAIVVISGTGSNCFGKNNKGKFAKAGGLDYLLADEGSGYFIGGQVLKAITKSLDGRGQKTILADLFQKAFDVKTLDELVELVYKNPWGKVEVAKVSQLLGAAIGKKDKVAIKIAERAAQELALMVKIVAHKLGFGASSHFTVVKSGSVFENAFVSGLFDELVNREFIKACLVRPKIKAAVGAAFLALETFSNPQKVK